MLLAVKELRRLIEGASQRQEFEHVFDEIVMAVNEIENVEVSEPTGQTTHDWRSIEIWLASDATVRDLRAVYDQVLDTCKNILVTMTGEKPFVHYERVILAGREQAPVSHMKTDEVLLVVRARQERNGLHYVKVQVKRPIAWTDKTVTHEAYDRPRPDTEMVELLKVELEAHFRELYGDDSVAVQTSNEEIGYTIIQVLTDDTDDESSPRWSSLERFSEDVKGVMYVTTGEQARMTCDIERCWVYTGSVQVTTDLGAVGFTRRTGHILSRKTEPNERIAYVRIEAR